MSHGYQIQRRARMEGRTEFLWRNWPPVVLEIWVLSCIRNVWQHEDLGERDCEWVSSVTFSVMEVVSLAQSALFRCLWAELISGFGCLMLRANSLEKTLMLGKSEGRRRRGWQSMASLTQWTLVWASSGFGDGQRSLACCSPWVYKESDMT